MKQMKSYSNLKFTRHTHTGDSQEKRKETSLIIYFHIPLYR